MLYYMETNKTYIAYLVEQQNLVEKAAKERCIDFFPEFVFDILKILSRHSIEFLSYCFKSFSKSLYLDRPQWTQKK